MGFRILYRTPDCRVTPYKSNVSIDKYLEETDFLWIITLLSETVESDECFFFSKSTYVERKFVKYYIPYSFISDFRVSYTAF